jgi:hypothetical protein
MAGAFVGAGAELIEAREQANRRSAGCVADGSANTIARHFVRRWPFRRCCACAQALPLQQARGEGRLGHRREVRAESRFVKSVASEVGIANVHWRMAYRYRISKCRHHGLRSVSVVRRRPCAGQCRPVRPAGGDTCSRGSQRCGQDDLDAHVARDAAPRPWVFARAG